MKNLNKKLLQNLKPKIRLYRNKHEAIFNINLIGFEEEYYYPASKDYKTNIYNYNHTVSYNNIKLRIKYPKVLKSEYKQWLKYNK